jgi:3'-5' exonuclease
MNVLVFALKTLPDIDGARRLYDLHGLSDDDVARAVLHKRRQLKNTESFPLPLQKVASISAVFASPERFKVWSLGDEQSSEPELLQRFFDGIERYTPQLISWGGIDFDLPILHYRSLLYPVNAARYWEQGENDASFRENNYQSRNHPRHTDLKDVLAALHGSAAVTLNEIARLCGFPGIPVAQQDDQNLQQICEIEVLNNYLIFLNWERNRGNLDESQYQQRCNLIRTELKQSDTAHLIEFESNWIDY